jgi:hypothetical protein
MEILYRAVMIHNDILHKSATPMKPHKISKAGIRNIIVSGHCIILVPYSLSTTLSKSAHIGAIRVIRVPF